MGHFLNTWKQVTAGKSAMLIWKGEEGIGKRDWAQEFKVMVGEILKRF
ncbi:hypothetical protein O9H85_05715 [Paenibacillus filicis]|uniref:Uncharacterized protein n=1 Tax=Paenibacillus gyeongsangnamensis TaxID=3388067 RepID=A0ABT4Q560_9BACL|nr:hypothetical protein [Paenibacillus filicis]MCZ8511926.1 hypothetical protein [Paenibacillus filicis]